MAGPPNSSPAAPPSLQKSSSSSKNQTSIAGFFRKKDSVSSTNGTPSITGTRLPVNSLSKSNGIKKASVSSSQSLTPAPSSDTVEEHREEAEMRPVKKRGKYGSNGLPSPMTPVSVVDASDLGQENIVPKGFYSPSRKVSIFPTTSGSRITDKAATG